MTARLQLLQRAEEEKSSIERTFQLSESCCTQLYKRANEQCREISRPYMQDGSIRGEIVLLIATAHDQIRYVVDRRTQMYRS